jgi:hypothetical protein
MILLIIYAIVSTLVIVYLIIKVKHYKPYYRKDSLWEFVEGEYYKSGYNYGFGPDYYTGNIFIEKYKGFPIKYRINTSGNLPQNCAIWMKYRKKITELENELL